MIAAELLQPCVQAAVQAPSSHNTQPWWFRLGPDRIELHADRTRALPVNDPHDRELTISCGCALFNLRVAAAHAGLVAQCTLNADATLAEPLASLQLRWAEPGELPDVDPGLHAAIARRHTCREPFTAEPVASATVDALTVAAFSEGAWLRPVDDPEQRRATSALVAEGDAAQWANPHWRRELAAWMHPRRQGDGLPVSTLVRPMAQIVVRQLDLGAQVAARDRAFAEGSPYLGLLCTPGDTPSDWLCAGQALQHLLLVATQTGLQAAYLNQPIQVAPLRLQLAERLATPGPPQILLRLGRPLHPDGSAATTRRAVAAVVEHDMPPSA